MCLLVLRSQLQWSGVELEKEKALKEGSIRSKTLMQKWRVASEHGNRGAGVFPVYVRLKLKERSAII